MTEERAVQLQQVPVRKTRLCGTGNQVQCERCGAWGLVPDHVTAHHVFEGGVQHVDANWCRPCLTGRSYEHYGMRPPRRDIEMGAMEGCGSR